MGKIYNISKQIDFNNLTYKLKDKNLTPINFIGFRGPLSIYENIKNGKISIEKAKENQKQFELNLNAITTGNPKTKSKDRLDTMENIKNLYESREEIIKLYNDYAKINAKAV